MKRTWSQANANEYGQLGIIESVKLRNFMCHDNLSFDFDPHMNFIIGRNGSGKSAVLTGIILALGGKSSSTGRFYNIKGFVKEGKNTASVSVTLKNCGPDAYKPDVYGEKITIERQFTTEGANSYKLKSESGKIISTAKEELTNILTVMDIQVENPVTVLVQDTSKNFLVSKTAKGDKLFKLFYDGTGLSKVYEDYNRSMHQNQESKADLQKKKEVLVDIGKEVKKIKNLLNKSAKINELEKELLWSIVIQLEKERDAAQKRLEKQQSTTADLLTKLNHYTGEMTEISQKIMDAELGRKSSQDKMADARKNIKDFQNKKSDLDSDIRETEGTRKRHKREFERIGSMILGLEEQMNQARVLNQHTFDAEKSKHESIIKDLQKKLAEVNSSINLYSEQEVGLNNQLQNKQKDINTCAAEVMELVHEKERVVKERSQVINGLKSRINVFGTEMKAVLNDIRDSHAAGNFKVQPIGPIGLYINVKEEKWNFAIQECLKLAFLRSFICDNNEDAEQLSKIFNKYYKRQRPSVLISKFASQVYNVNAHKCVSSYPTVLDMLNISAPVVANTLIDQKQIENILLVESPTVARDLVLENLPAKCLCVYSCNGDQFCHSPIRKYSCRNKNSLCVFGIQEDDLARKAEEIKKLDILISQKKAHKETLLQDLNFLKGQISLCCEKYKEFKLEENELKMKITNEESSYVELRDINSLQAEWDSYNQEKKDLEVKLDLCHSALASKTRALSDIDEQLADFLRIIQAEPTNFTELSKKVEEYQSEKEKLDLASKKVKSQLVKLQQDLKNKESELANCNATVKVSTERAINLCDRIDTERSPDTLRSLITELRNHLQKEKNIDREKLILEYEEKVKNMNKSKSELLKHEKLNDRLVNMVNERFQEFKKICKNTSVALTCAFITLLKDNRFTGFLHVNFENKTLDIFATPENSMKKFGKKPNLSQLSGGERSYVTIAFLLALWDRIHSPFRILDEYDVFMDPNNRHRSINLLISNARSNKKIQYIFLSPLELPHIEDSDHVKVHKMSDPRS